jgi:3-dehydroquinate dehydratase type I
MQTAGADACKVVTTAITFEDNIKLLKLLRAYPKTQLTAFAMGDIGLTGRVLGPLVGGGIVYTSLKRGSESAPGQLTASEWRELYRLVSGDNG